MAKLLAIVTRCGLDPSTKRIFVWPTGVLMLQTLKPGRTTPRPQKYIDINIVRFKSKF